MPLSYILYILAQCYEAFLKLGAFIFGTELRIFMSANSCERGLEREFTGTRPDRSAP